MKMYFDMEEPSDSWDISEYGAVMSDMDDLWSNINIDKKSDKFELLDNPIGDLTLEDISLNDIFNLALDEETNKIVHHDCMWAGVCGDKYHPGNSSAAMSFQSCSSIIPDMYADANNSVPPQVIFNMVPTQPAHTTTTNTAGRSLLLSSARTVNSRPPRSPKKMSVQQQQSPKRPETPPESFDEEEPPQFKHHIDIATFVPRTAIVGRTPSKMASIEYDYATIDEEDSDAEGDYKEYVHPSYSSRNSRQYRENTIASDHSYTLCKSAKQQRIEIPGVQTPSDSEEEEEIDVESLGGDKYTTGVRSSDGLPTNPSVLDRHQLQRTVASAMSVRTLQQQRPGRTVCTPSRPRKRPRDRSPPTQQSRYRKRKKLSTDPRRSPTERRGIVNSDSEAENLEKRSLHNDMERQRRISLKKLFDELKNEVPSIRDKERAPKVLILREAAALCTKLQREERDREQLAHYQSRLLKRLKSLRMDLAARRPNV